MTALVTSGGTESVLDVAGNIEFGSGVNTMNIGYGSTFTAEDIDASKGSVSVIGIGAESKAEVGEVNLGEGYNVVTAGWNSEVSTGAISGVTALITATESVLDVAGDIEFGSGVNTMNIGYASEFIAGNVIMGDSSDWIGIGAESDVMLGDLDFGEGHDSMYIGWKADVEIGAISGLEELWVDAGATIAVADIADLEGVGGNWKQANIFEKGTLG